MSYQINFTKVLNGIEVIDFTYGNFATKLDAAKEISKEVIRINDSDDDYFSHFTDVMSDDFKYDKFNWLHNIDDIDSIAETAVMWIAERGHGDENYVEWYII